MDDARVYEALLHAVDASVACVLATVVRTHGSVPRSAGSKMLIDASGTLVGTIGGGCGEGDVIAAVPDVLRTGKARVLHIALTDSISSWSPAVCGGTMEILLEPVLPPTQQRQP